MNQNIVPQPKRFGPPYVEPQGPVTIKRPNGRGTLTFEGSERMRREPGAPLLLVQEEVPDDLEPEAAPAAPAFREPNSLRLKQGPEPGAPGYVTPAALSAPSAPSEPPAPPPAGTLERRLFDAEAAERQATAALEETKASYAASPSDETFDAFKQARDAHDRTSLDVEAARATIAAERLATWDQRHEKLKLELAEAREVEGSWKSSIAHNLDTITSLYTNLLAEVNAIRRIESDVRSARSRAQLATNQLHAHRQSHPTSPEAVTPPPLPDHSPVSVAGYAKAALQQRIELGDLRSYLP